MVEESNGSTSQSAGRPRANDDMIFNDIVEGKGEGTLFLLFGPPGVGKTLTAEAMAESLHLPLYSVSMGELGTSADVLEERLGGVLALCAQWGALVLLDEAEILLERRSKGDVVRNAMVCVMLRLLEFFHGILFLTCNRVTALDPAVQSRVTCALRYQSLDAVARETVWRELLGLRFDFSSPDKKIRLRASSQGSSNGSHNCAQSGERVASAELDCAALAAHDLNGREIKNALRLAIALARREQVPLAMRHLRITIAIAEEFVTAVRSGVDDIDAL